MLLNSVKVFWLWYTMISTLLLIDVSYHLLKKAWRSLSFHDFKKTVVTRIWPNFRLLLPFFSDNFKENTHTCLKRPVEINVRGEILDFFIDMPSLSTIFQDFWQRFGKCDIFSVLKFRTIFQCHLYRYFHAVTTQNLCRLFFKILQKGYFKRELFGCCFSYLWINIV